MKMPQYINLQMKAGETKQYKVIESFNLYDHTFVIHKNPVQNNWKKIINKYAVSEYSTGKQCGYGKTVVDARRAAKQAIKHVGKEGLQKVVAQNSIINN
jgi:hypothetical protein